jgi:hypothetical protein
MHSLALPLALSLTIGATLIAEAAPPNARPGVLQPYSSDAHRPGPGGAYGGLKSNPPRGAGDARDLGNKEPYYYRYYSDTDRSPGSCRRYARRAIVTKNSNWWTRYRACLK